MSEPIQTYAGKTLAPENAARIATGLSAFLVITLGVFLLFGAGFAHSGALHDAAHDVRHANALPCH